MPPKTPPTPPCRMGPALPLHSRPPVPGFVPPSAGPPPTGAVGGFHPAGGPRLETALRSHPDRAFALYILNGLTQGLRIRFNRAHPLRSASANMGSAYLHPEVTTAYLQKELSLGRMLGPFPLSFPVPELHFNPCGVVPKGHNTGKWWLITNLSFPAGRSVNDGIDTDWSSLAYTTVDRVAEIAVCLGRGALLAKVDFESAYRLIPVHPCHRPLQAVCWQGQVYVDPMLPFGLRSAPKIFTAVADALHWFLVQRGIKHIQHYLDDFIIVSFPDSPQCRDELETLLRVFRELGIPVATHKTEGPATCLVFLGIEIDTGELRLPQDKLQRLHSLLSQWGDKRVCSRKELESLIGLLNHACKVVRTGRSFLRRMIDLLHSHYVSRAATQPQSVSMPASAPTSHGGDLFCTAGMAPPTCLLPLCCPNFPWRPMRLVGGAVERSFARAGSSSPGKGPPSIFPLR